MSLHRDPFKTTFRMLVVLAPPTLAQPPAELRHDTIVLADPLPDPETLTDLITKLLRASGVTAAQDAIVRAVDTVRGLSRFVAEQACAMSLCRSGFDWDALMAQRHDAIAQVQGASVYTGPETWDDVVGLAGLKKALARFAHAKKRVRVVVFLDEVEKGTAGSGANGQPGDNTGVSQRQMGHLLTWMQNRRIRGVLLYGHPGTGKSLIAKALARLLGVPCIMGDLGRMMDSLVGSSEANTEAFTAMVDAIGGDEGVLVIATCNSMDSLSTEFRRRFTRGTWFLDLATEAANRSAEAHYRKKHGIAKTDRTPDFTGWTPAEIEAVCAQAEDYGIPLAESAETIVPVAQAQPEVIASRRRYAHQRLLDAETGRKYVMPGVESPDAITPEVSLAVLPRAIANMKES